MSAKREQNASPNSSSDASSNDPPEKRVKYCVDDLIKELKLFEGDELKTGFTNCTKAVITIDNHEIDLNNITSEAVSKFSFNETSNKKGQKGKLKMKKNEIGKPIEKKLENVNNHFLNFLGQSIASKQLGENYQAIPHEFVIYRKNDFRSPCDNVQENGVGNFLIVVCPTVCKGGDINFPQLDSELSVESNKSFNYVFFGIETQYEVTKVTEGLRVLIIYKIVENNFQVGVKKLPLTNNQKLANIMENMKKKNVLISFSKDSALEEILNNVSQKCIEVYADEENPEIVYDEISDYQPHTYLLDYLKFKDLVSPELSTSNSYAVRKHIQLSKPKKEYETLTKYYDSRHGRDYKIYYYVFMLINPCSDKNHSSSSSSSSSD